MRFVNNPFKGTMPGKADDDNESQWNSGQRAPKDGSASPAAQEFGDRSNKPVTERGSSYSPFGGKSYN